MQLATFYPILYRILQPSFPSCLWAGNVNSKVIALTFDDGPHPHYTPALLEVLDQYSIPASFFWLGACVNRSPAIAKIVPVRIDNIRRWECGVDFPPAISPDRQ